MRLPDVFARGTRLVVGFSGGQDSTCLLHALANAHRDLSLLAVHVDHGLQPDSAAAAEQVQRSAEAIGVRCEVVRVDVGAYRRASKRSSMEQAARATRYQALAAAADQHHAAAILVAHTADDQAETMLLNLVRGTGLLGLAGMRIDEKLDMRRLGLPASGAPCPSGPARLVRPLLRIARATTLAYCTHFGLTIVEDVSNQTRAFTRNRVRLDLLPLLEQFNPAIREVLARAADLVADDLAVLDAVVAEIHTAIQRDGEYELRRFRAQPRGLQRRLLRLGLERIGLGLVDVGDVPIEDALDLLQTGQPKQTYDLPYNVQLSIESETFMLRRDHTRRPDKTWDVVAPRV